MTNNPIKHQSFVYTQLNDQIVQFLSIQFNRNHFCTEITVKQFYLTVSWDPLRCYHSVCNGNEGLFHIPQISKVGAPPSESFVSYLVWHYELDICTYMYTHVCVCTHICVRVCVYIYAHAHVCPHTHTYTHTHTHTHARTHMWQDELDSAWVSNFKC